MINEYLSLNSLKKTFFFRGYFIPFISKSFQMWDHFFFYFSQRIPIL